MYEKRFFNLLVSVAQISMMLFGTNSQSTQERCWSVRTQPVTLHSLGHHHFFLDFWDTSTSVCLALGKRKYAKIFILKLKKRTMSVFPMFFLSDKGKHIHNKIRKFSSNKKVNM